MFNRIKWFLLDWLLGGLCKKSECDACDAYVGNHRCCHQSYVYRQAKKVWGIDNGN